MKEHTYLRAAVLQCLGFDGVQQLSRQIGAYPLLLSFSLLQRRSEPELRAPLILFCQELVARVTGAETEVRRPAWARSELGQDEWVLLHHPAPGTYVDIGANSAEHLRQASRIRVPVRSRAHSIAWTCNRPRPVMRGIVAPVRQA